MNDYTEQLDNIQELIDTKFPELGYNRPQQYHLTVYLGDFEKDELEEMYNEGLSYFILTPFLEIFPFGYLDDTFVVHMWVGDDVGSVYTPSPEDIQAFVEQNEGKTPLTLSAKNIFERSENSFDELPVFFDYLIWYDNNH